jgi:hypothetical protein
MSRWERIMLSFFIKTTFKMTIISEMSLEVSVLGRRRWRQICRPHDRRGGGTVAANMRPGRVEGE